MTSAAARIPGPDTDGFADIAEVGGLHNYQLKLHAEYGPVARFRLPGADTAVSVADPVLLEAAAKIDKRPEKLFEFLAPLQESDNLQTIDAARHTPWRRALLSVLAGRPSHEAHFGEFVALAGDLADRWAAADGPIPLQHDLSALSLRLICAYALGSDSAEPDRIVAAFHDVLSEYLTRLYQPDAPSNPEWAQAALAYLRHCVDEVLAANRGGSELIAALAAAGQPPARIRDSVLMTMLAAHHTTGVAVSWTLYLLARHPDITERVVAELAEVLGARPAPDYADLKRLTYLGMVLKESMRLYPPGPYGARETTEELRLGEYLLPAGTTIFCPIWAIHLNPEYWPAPEVFDPERFTPARSAERPRLAYLPFGFGPRSCEGAALAQLEAELMLAILLRRFHFEIVADHPVVPIERFVLWAADDILMRVTPR